MEEEEISFDRPNKVYSTSYNSWKKTVHVFDLDLLFCLEIRKRILAMKTTKQLAREHGFLRERKLSLSSGVSNRKKQPSQNFHYLIVIDFESTCWDKDRTKTQEIIEFPAVLFNTKTGQIEDEFHYYVQPQEHPTLSSFCKKLTGISQDQVHNGIPLFLCLRKFSHWLHKLFEEKTVCLVGDRPNVNADSISNLAAIVTWSDWDLGVCLKYEVKRKQIPKSPCFNQWIDLRATYTKFYGRRPKGLNGALQDIGIEFEGREHSGLHDARNTAVLAWRMIRDGCVLNITKSVDPAPSNLAGQQAYGKNGIEKTIRKKESPQICVVSRAENVSCHRDLEISSVVKGGNGPELKSGSNTGLKMRDPNIPQSDDTGGVKRPAMVSPEKMSSVKSLKLSSPNDTDLKYSSSRVDCFVSPSLITKTGCALSTGINSNTVYTSFVTLGGAPNAPISTHIQTPLGYESKMQRSKKTGTLTGVTPSRVDGNIRKIAPLSKTSNFKTVPVNFYPTPCRLHESRQSVSGSEFRAPSIQNFQDNGSSGCVFKTPLIQAQVTKVSSGDPANTKETTPTVLVSKSLCSSSTATNSGHFKTLHKSNTFTPVSSSLKTPQNQPHNRMAMSSMKATPPLCQCGRRAKRRMVQNPGPNMGRWFFSCVKGTACSADSKIKGCSFFQWEHSVKILWPR